MTKIDKTKFNIIEDGGKDFILASEVSDYAQVYFKSRFRIPTYRSVRLYVTKGILERPEKWGKLTYFEIGYVMGAIQIIRLLSHTYYPKTQQLRRIVANARKANNFDEVISVITDSLGKFGNMGARAAFVEALATEGPRDGLVSEILKKYPERDDE